MNLIYLSNIKKMKISDHIILFPYFYNHNRNLCDKFTSLWIFYKIIEFVVINIVWSHFKIILKTKKMSFKLDILLIRVVRVSYECRCPIRVRHGHTHWWGMFEFQEDNFHKLNLRSCVILASWHQKIWQQ